MIIIPIKWLFHWEYTLFSNKPKSVRISDLRYGHRRLSMDSQSGVWGPHFQLSSFLVPFKIRDLHLRVKQTKAVTIVIKAVTIVSKGTDYEDYEENIPGTTRKIRNSHVHVMLSMATVHCATMRHQQQSNTLHAVAPADFYGGFGKIKHAQRPTWSFFQEEYGTSMHLPDSYAFLENEQRGNASQRGVEDCCF